MKVSLLEKNKLKKLLKEKAEKSVILFSSSHIIPLVNYNTDRIAARATEYLIELLQPNSDDMQKQITLLKQENRLLEQVVTLMHGQQKHRDKHRYKNKG